MFAVITNKMCELDPEGDIMKRRVIYFSLYKFQHHLAPNVLEINGRVLINVLEEGNE